MKTTKKTKTTPSVVVTPAAPASPGGYTIGLDSRRHAGKRMGAGESRLRSYVKIFACPHSFAIKEAKAAAGSGAVARRCARVAEMQPQRAMAFYDRSAGL